MIIKLIFLKFWRFQIESFKIIWRSWPIKNRWIDHIIVVRYEKYVLSWLFLDFIHRSWIMFYSISWLNTLLKIQIYNVHLENFFSSVRHKKSQALCFKLWCLMIFVILERIFIAVKILQQDWKFSNLGSTNQSLRIEVYGCVHFLFPNYICINFFYSYTNHKILRIKSVI